MVEQKEVRGGSGAKQSVRGAACVAVLVMTTFGVHAQVPPHGCSAPVRPSDEEMKKAPVYNQFYRAATRYQECLMAYADKQKAVADQYTGAANGAIGEWNDFVKKNAAKDQKEEESN